MVVVTFIVAVVRVDTVVLVDVVLVDVVLGCSCYVWWW